MSVPVKGFKEIYDDMKTWLIANQSKLSDFNDGSVISSLLEAIAIEMSKLYRFTSNSFSEYLLQIPYKVFNLKRKDGIKASGYVVFSRTSPATSDITIPKGTLVSTTSGIQFETTQIGTISTGNTSSGNVPIQALIEGTTGNLNTGSITLIVYPISGVESVTNPNPTTGGIDEESDTEFQRRFYEYILGLGGVSKYAFISKAKEVNEVRSVGIVEHIPPLDNVYNFTMYIDNGMGDMPQEILDNVVNLIDGDGTYTNPGIRPPGIQIRYLAPTKVPVDITATVTTVEGIDKDLLKSVIVSELTVMLNSKQIGEDVYLSKIIGTITQINNVIDVTVTEPSSNISISESQIARAGTLTVTIV